MKVDRELIERIIHLHDIEKKGFRKIANELCMSKSSVHRIYKEQAVALKEKREKELDGNEEYKTLKDKRLRLQKEVEQVQTIEDERKKIKQLYLQKAETWEGLQDIFGSPEEMLELTQATVGDYRSWYLDSPRVLESFMSYCQAHNLPLAETLFEVVGSLEEYEADMDKDGTLLDLDNYIGLQLEYFLDARQEEEMQETLQKKFSDILLSFRCPDCGADATSLLLIDGEVCCRCGSRFELLCPNCKRKLQFKEGTYHCRSCGMSFERPVMKVSYREIVAYVT